MSSAGKFIFRYNRARIFIFIRNNILKRWKGSSEGKQDRISKVIFFSILQTGMYTYSLHVNRATVCLIFHSIIWYVYNVHCYIEYKTNMIEGGTGVLPKKMFSSFHTKWLAFFPHFQESSGQIIYFSFQKRTEYLFSAFSRLEYLFPKSASPLPLRIKWLSPKTTGSPSYANYPLGAVKLTFKCRIIPSVRWKNRSNLVFCTPGWFSMTYRPWA